MADREDRQHDERVHHDDQERPADHVGKARQGDESGDRGHQHDDQDDQLPAGVADQAQSGTGGGHGRRRPAEQDAPADCGRGDHPFHVGALRHVDRARQNVLAKLRQSLRAVAFSRRLPSAVAPAKPEVVVGEGLCTAVPTDSLVDTPEPQFPCLYIL